MNLIQNKKQFEDFIDNFMPEFEKDEVYFISLSARNKYLTDEERIKYSLGRTEMFGREVAKSKEELKTYTIKKLEATLNYRTTNNGSKIPEHALVMYININPSSMIKAYFQFQKEMNRQIEEVFFANQNNKNPNYTFITRGQREFMNCIQKSSSRKYFIDIDCDSKDIDIKNFIGNKLIDEKAIFHIVQTQGGYHFLIIKKSLEGRKIDLNRICKDAEAMGAKEVSINSNAMIPVPGTLQAGKEVKLIYSNYF